jgi:hypothetical protein
MNRVFPRGVRVATWPAWNLQYCAGRPSRLLRETLRTLRCFLPGIAMMKTAQLSTVRSDAKFLANSMLAVVPQLRRLILPVDISGGANASGPGLRQKVLKVSTKGSQISESRV